MRSAVHALRPPPSAWVCRWATAIPAGARVLDFAGGAGRNLAPLLARDAHLTVADRDPAALARIAEPVDRMLIDLESGPWPFSRGAFDAVICCNYLFRPRLALLCDLVAPGGRLIYETFALGNARYGRPSNPAYLLKPLELIESVRRSGLRVVAFEDGEVDAPAPALVQRVYAVRVRADAIERLPLG